MQADDPPAPPKKKAPKDGPPKKGESVTITSRVKKMTEAPKGEIDGAELTDGTVIHWPPHLEKKFTAVVKVGDEVKVMGEKMTTPEGDKKVEVRTLTNTRTDETVRNDEPKKGKDKKDKKDKKKKDSE